MSGITPLLFRKLCNLAAHRIANTFEYQRQQAKAEINLLNHQLNQMFMGIGRDVYDRASNIPFIEQAHYYYRNDPKYQENQAKVGGWKNVLSQLSNEVDLPLTESQIEDGQRYVEEMLIRGFPENLSPQEKFFISQVANNTPKDWAYFSDEYTTAFEPTLGELVLNKRQIGCITRNSYGVACLNSYQSMFADIDLHHAEEYIPFSSMPWGRRDVEKEEIIELINDVAKRNNLIFQVYQTCNGFRLLEMSRNWDAISLESQNILEQLQCDRIYQQLCVRQLCYRARLEIKPWRKGNTVCRDLVRIGEGQVTDEAACVQLLHDRWCLSWEQGSILA